MARGVEPIAIAILLLSISCASTKKSVAPRAKPIAVKKKSEPSPVKDPLERPPPPPIGSCGEAPRSEEKPSRSGWIWPVDGVVVDRNEGIDIAAPEGTPIWAARGGSVLFAGERAGYGRIVIVRHDGEVSLYANNAKNCVSEGASVEVGDVVGLVGTSGGSASPKVHFEVRKGEKAVNPRILLP